MTKTALDGSATGCIAKRDLTDSASMRAFEDNFGRGALQLVRPHRSHGQDLRNTSSSLNLSMNERLKFGGSRAVLSVRVWVWCQNRTVVTPQGPVGMLSEQPVQQPWLAGLQAVEHGVDVEHVRAGDRGQNDDAVVWLVGVESEDH